MPTLEQKQQILDAALKEKWFHAIQLGESQTSGRFPEGTPQNRTLYGVMDLLSHVSVDGMRCLDIGTVNGITAFNISSRGGDVVATDIYPVKNKGFALAEEFLDLKVDYCPSVDFSNILEVLPKHSFDVVVCAGVLYHMLNPFDSILKCRALLKRGGILIFESAFLAGSTGAYLNFNPVTESIKEVYTYWMPTKGALLGMLRFTGFDVRAIRTILNPDRIAFLCVSSDFDAISHRSDMMKRLHDTGIQDPIFPDSPPEMPISKANFTGKLGDQTIDWATYTPDFFPHPVDNLHSLGRTVWMSKNKNF